MPYRTPDPPPDPDPEPFQLKLPRATWFERMLCRFGLHPRDRLVRPWYWWYCPVCERILPWHEE